MSNSGDKVLVRTTCPRDCYDACGIVVVKRGNAITRVLGDPDHHVSRGALCGKCAIAYNGAWRDTSLRLSTPLRRIGPKGSRSFTPVSWDEALGLIAEKLNGAIQSYGGRSIVHSHYTGTCSMLAGWFPLRLLNRIGATEIDPDSVCNKAGHTALENIFGDSGIGFDPRTSKDAACIMVWGANPFASAPHQHIHWLPESKAKRIVIDPIRHQTAAESDIHLQLRPGTDAALAFALLHVIEREGLIDRKFIKVSVSGWDEIEPQLATCTPAWGEQATGVPAALIEQVATMYGRGPSLLWLGQGLQRQPTGGNVFRACTLLPIATGMMGKPGTGLLYMNGVGSRGIYMDYLTGAHLRPAGAEAPVSHMDLVDRLNDRSATQAFLTWNNNIAASSPQQNQLRDALSDEELFHVAIDLFQTDTTAYADIVLPAASFLEFDDLVLSYFHYSLSAQVKATEPTGQSQSNQAIFRKLAGAMGLDDPELFEDDAHMISRLLRQTGTGISFSELSLKGTLPYRPWPLIPFADGKYPTRSRKIEILSDKFVSAGLSRVPTPSVDRPPQNGRLRVLSPASEWLMNSSYGNDKRICQLQGPAAIGVHPQEASSRGFADGDLVDLENETGTLGPLQVQTDVRVPRGVALVPKGRWPGLSAGSANVNVLNPGLKSDLAESSSVHGIEADISAHVRRLSQLGGADKQSKTTEASL